MSTEIYWTAENEDDADPLPGEVTQVINAGGETRIVFSGQATAFGDRYQGVLRLARRLSEQTIVGKLSYKTIDEDWVEVPFSVVGSFKNRRFDSFSGIWFEHGKGCRVEINGLPSFAPKRKKKRKPNTSRGRRRRPRIK